MGAHNVPFTPYEATAYIMYKISCPVCLDSFYIESEVRIDDIIDCESCESDLVITKLVALDND